MVFDEIPTHFLPQNWQQTAAEIDNTKLILTWLYGVLFNNNTKKKHDVKVTFCQKYWCSENAFNSAPSLNLFVVQVTDT